VGSNPTPAAPPSRRRTRGNVDFDGGAGIEACQPSERRVQVYIGGGVLLLILIILLIIFLL
jgi:hypothetical protein